MDPLIYRQISRQTHYAFGRVRIRRIARRACCDIRVGDDRNIRNLFRSARYNLRLRNRYASERGLNLSLATLHVSLLSLSGRSGEKNKLDGSAIASAGGVSRASLHQHTIRGSKPACLSGGYLERSRFYYRRGHRIGAFSGCTRKYPGEKCEMGAARWFFARWKRLLAGARELFSYRFPALPADRRYSPVAEKPTPVIYRYGGWTNSGPRILIGIQITQKSHGNTRAPDYLYRAATSRARTRFALITGFLTL